MCTVAASAVYQPPCPAPLPPPEPSADMSVQMMQLIQTPEGLARVTKRLSQMDRNQLIAFTTRLSSFQQAALFRAVLKGPVLDGKPQWYYTFAQYAGPAIDEAARQAWLRPQEIGRRTHVTPNLRTLEERPTFQTRHDLDERSTATLKFAGALSLTGLFAALAIAFSAWFLLPLAAAALLTVYCGSKASKHAQT